MRLFLQNWNSSGSVAQRGKMPNAHQRALRPGSYQEHPNTTVRPATAQGYSQLSHYPATTKYARLPASCTLQNMIIQDLMEGAALCQHICVPFSGWSPADDLQQCSDEAPAENCAFPSHRRNLPRETWQAAWLQHRQKSSLILTATEGKYEC